MRACRALLRDVSYRVRSGAGPAGAAAISLSGLWALLAALTLSAGLLGLLSAGNHSLADNAAAWLGLSGETADLVTSTVRSAESAGGVASVGGAIGLLITAVRLGSSLAGALARSQGGLPPRGPRSWVRSAGWFAGATVLGAMSVLSPMLSVGWASMWWWPAGIVCSFAAFAWTMSVLADHPRSVVVGALVGTAGFEALKAVSALALPSLVRSGLALYGSIGVVAALLVWLGLLSQLFVWCACLNAALAERRELTTATGRPAAAPHDGSDV